MSNRDFALPKLGLRFSPIWQRHWLVWKRSRRLPSSAIWLIR
jgi:hypothetical protein